MIEAAEINLTDWDFWKRPRPERYEAFRVLRRQETLPRFPEPQVAGLPTGPGYYAVTRHADVVEASRRPKDFCSGQGAISIPDMPTELNEYFGSMINMDDPRHARLRRIVSRAFTPRMIQRFEDHVEDVAARIVARVRDGGTGEFVSDVAARLPLTIICELMGIPDAHYQTVLDASNTILAGADPEYVEDVTDYEKMATGLLNAGQTLINIMEELARDRRANPTDDLTSALVNANIDGESLTDQELGSFFILLAVAGNETTRNAIAHGLHLFTTHPDQRALLAEDFEGRIAGAVEEIVRYASPVIWMRRTATCDTTLNGHEIKAGDKLLLYYASANRDETVFDDPDRFDILRSPNPHVGFGGPGPHFCLGAHLARREVTVMFRELFRQVPTIRAAGEPEWLLSNFVNGIKRLPYEI
ncbi:MULTISPECIES: cytochrome P450 [Thermomonospora]|uniref:Cytochrome P450 n=1 Tax=Thermomonospora curvata (strain ATCC 19995 / DSM 43183 / JCM 3096 / KCTC 9072 / NBRC 15933 / NCIMB 10081 / Henssen B9) TaxID=471852 RepID=D1ABC0_THECD|nr:MULTISPECIES: cytochrome P450 [Thermomonospora]ACY97156.1 cytochrome P450 [Thermomonospora curvata DSM 43183]PKK15018.1 MAG: cytochrome P450 [Thermomonospora sp. CIF 1]